MMTCLRALLPSGLRQSAGAEAVADRFARWAPPIRDDPFGHFAEARVRRPVQRVCLADGQPARVLLGYDAARHMLNVDPPDHTRLRRLVALAFVPSRIAALEPAHPRHRS